MGVCENLNQNFSLFLCKKQISKQEQNYCESYSVIHILIYFEFYYKHQYQMIKGKNIKHYGIEIFKRKLFFVRVEICGLQ